MNAILRSMNLETKILIVDDDEGIRSLVSSFLEKHGFSTETAADPAHMRKKLESGTYDLIVLDVMMPGEDGLSALRKLQVNGGPPVIMLSAVGTEIDKVVGLEMGADDYMAKPCNPRELLARIRTVLRRHEGGKTAQVAVPVKAVAAHQDQKEMLRFANWKMDPIARILYDPKDKLVTLSDGEFRLLRAFVEHPRRVLTRDQLLEYARGHDTEHFDRAIDVQVSRLRRKMSSSDGVDDLIRTVRNEGYMFVPPVTRE